MNLDELLPAGSLDALSAQLGVPRDQAQQGAQALLPAILAGMGDKAGGADAPDATALESHVEALGGGGLADNVIGPQPTDVDKGNQLLGGIFGSKEVSREVAGQAAQNTGLDPALLKKMLPILAMLAAGYLAKRGGQQGGLSGVLGSVLGGLAGSGGGLGGGLGSVLGGGGSGLGGMLGSILGGRR